MMKIFYTKIIYSSKQSMQWTCLRWTEILLHKKFLHKIFANKTNANEALSLSVLANYHSLAVSRYIAIVQLQ